MVEVTLYTRAGCTLCDKAKAALLASGVPVRIAEVDIDADAALRERYTNDIPVIMVDGTEVFRHRVDPVAFARFVQNRETVLASGWTVVDGHRLEKEYAFPDFAQALAFTNRVGALAEEANHHPDIHLAWGRVCITLWTHTTGGVTRKDFALAAKIEKLHQSPRPPGGEGPSP